jgi:arylsulfatase A
MIRAVSQRPHRNHNLRLPSMTIQVRQLLPAFFLAGTCVGAVDSSNLAILEKQAKPNVVFVLADDMGYGDLACYGNPIVHSPNIDLLARQGIRFTQAYAPSPVCSPSRAGLLTGRTPVRLGVTDAIGDAGSKWNNGRRLSPPANPKSLALDEITLAEAFHKAGYATASIGKWHLGGKGHLPEDQGFDINFSGTSLGSQKSMFGPDYGIGLPPAPTGEHLAERLQHEAENFIHQNRDRPFFLYLSHYSVHRPIGARPETVSHYPEKGPPPWGLLPEYAAMIEELDATIGRLMTFLSEQGLAENTVVVFTSDNGAVKWWGSNGGLRGTKGVIYEGGIRVPLIIRQPGSAAGERLIDTPVHGCDLFPTLLDLAGICLPTGRAFDGLSLQPILRGEPGFPTDRPMLWHFPHYNMHGSTPATAMRLGKYKLIRFYETGHEELYDLSVDPAETVDLSETQPELLHQLGMRMAASLEEAGAIMPQINAGFPFTDPVLKELQPFESTRTKPSLMASPTDSSTQPAEGPIPVEPMRTLVEPSSGPRIKIGSVPLKNSAKRGLPFM